MEDPHLISVDELRAAGALDVPTAWRKSLGDERRHLLPGFEDDDESRAEEQQPSRFDSNGEESADEST